MKNDFRQKTLCLIAFATSLLVTACQNKPHAVRLQEEIEKTVRLDGPTAEGKKLYESTGCLACHGPQGRGDGVAAKGLNPPPRNYREIFGYKNGFKAANISRTIASGIPGTAMPPFSGLAEDERSKIANYVLFLQNQP